MKPSVIVYFLRACVCVFVVNFTVISPENLVVTIYRAGFGTKDSEFSRQLYLGSPHDSCNKRQLFLHAEFPNRSF